jgi:Co/Zn/Cd efflux system component
VRDGIRTVAASLAILGIAAAVQAAIFVLSGSVALLADLIHNVGDALTAVPFGVAFFLRSVRGERFPASSSYLRSSCRHALRCTKRSSD